MEFESRRTGAHGLRIKVSKISRWKWIGVEVEAAAKRPPHAANRKTFKKNLFRASDFVHADGAAVRSACDGRRGLA